MTRWQGREFTGSWGVFGGMGAARAAIQVDDREIVLRARNRDLVIPRTDVDHIVRRRFLWDSRFSWVILGNESNQYFAVNNPTVMCDFLENSGWPVRVRGWRAFTWS